MRTVPNRFPRIPRWAAYVLAAEVIGSSVWALASGVLVSFLAACAGVALFAAVPLSVWRSNRDSRRITAWWHVSAAYTPELPPAPAPAPVPAPAAASRNVESWELCESCRQRPAARFVIVSAGGSDEVFIVCDGCTPQASGPIEVVS